METNLDLFQINTDVGDILAGHNWVMADIVKGEVKKATNES